MSAENTTIVKFIESILFEEYKKADTFLNQIVEKKMRGKVKCACKNKKTEPFKRKRGKANGGKAENEDNKKPEWLEKIKKN